MSFTKKLNFSHFPRLDHTLPSRYHCQAVNTAGIHPLTPPEVRLCGCLVPPHILPLVLPLRASLEAEAGGSLESKSSGSAGMKCGSPDQMLCPLIAAAL